MKLMCNAISPERAVIWTVLFEGRADERLCAEHFTHEPYARWFSAALPRMAAGRELSADVVFSDADRDKERRALKRMLRVPPPPRVRANAELLVEALINRHAGLRMHIERLIN